MLAAALIASPQQRQPPEDRSFGLGLHATAMLVADLESISAELATQVIPEARPTGSLPGPPLLFPSVSYLLEHLDGTQFPALISRGKRVAYITDVIRDTAHNRTTIVSARPLLLKPRLARDILFRSSRFCARLWAFHVPDMSLQPNWCLPVASFRRAALVLFYPRAGSMGIACNRSKFCCVLEVVSQRREAWSGWTGSHGLGSGPHRHRRAARLGAGDAA